MIRRLTFGTFALLIFFSGVWSASASSTNGTIDATHKYAWSNNVGWINFATTNGNVHITDSALTGYIWDSHSGSINLAPAHGGVTNDGEGVLAGTAWSTGLGWINFVGVTIDTSGRFHGQASGSGIGILTFDCTHCAVITDWRPIGVRSPGTLSIPSTQAGGNGPITGPAPIATDQGTVQQPSAQLPETGTALPTPGDSLAQNAQNKNVPEKSPRTQTTAASSGPTSKKHSNLFDVSIQAASTQRSFPFLFASILSLIMAGMIALWFERKTIVRWLSRLFIEHRK